MASSIRPEFGYDPSCGDFCVSVLTKKSDDISSIDIQYVQCVDDEPRTYSARLPWDGSNVSVEDIEKLLDEARVPSHIQSVSAINMILKRVEEVKASRLPASIVVDISSDLETFEGYNEAIEGSDEDYEGVVELTAEPATKEAVESLERVEIRVSEEEVCCMVCMEDFRVERKAIRMLCSHVFHEGCIVKRLKSGHVCPLCRFELQY